MSFGIEGLALYVTLVVVNLGMDKACKQLGAISVAHKSWAT